MSGLLGQLLAVSPRLSERPACRVKDTASTSIPADSSSAFVLNSVTLASGDRVLFTALTSGVNNTVYQVTEVPSASGLTFHLVQMDDDAAANSPTPGAPKNFDMIPVLQGTSGGTFQCWWGGAWVSLDSL